MSPGDRGGQSQNPLGGDLVRMHAEQSTLSKCPAATICTLPMLERNKHHCSAKNKNRTLQHNTKRTKP